MGAKMGVVDRLGIEPRGVSYKSLPSTMTGPQRVVALLRVVGAHYFLPPGTCLSAFLPRSCDNQNS
jgi:hypothetical protein